MAATLNGEPARTPRRPRGPAPGPRRPVGVTPSAASALSCAARGSCSWSWPSAEHRGWH